MARAWAARMSLVYTGRHESGEEKAGVVSKGNLNLPQSGVLPGLE